MRALNFFQLGDRVTWRTPGERNAWESEHRRLVRLYGEGPFEVEPIARASRVPHPQQLVLKNMDGRTIEDRRGPQLFCGSWMKTVE